MVRGEKMKNKLLIAILVVCSISGFSQAAVIAPETDALLAALLGFEQKNFTEEEIKRMAQMTAAIEDVRKVIGQIQSVGKVAYSAGQNVQDLIDTTNDISELFGSSPVITKSFDEMTSLEQAQAYEELEKLRKKAVNTMTDFRDFGQNMEWRIDNIFDTVGAVTDAVQLFGGVADPNYAAMRATKKGIEIMNRQLSNLTAVVEGQSITARIDKELDIAEKNLDKAMKEQAKRERMAYMEKVNKSNNPEKLEAELKKTLGDTSIDMKKTFKTENNIMKPQRSYKEVYGW